ncbi:MAG: XRE family transcriptional regulator [Gemmataceae bacterium]
MTNPTPLPPDRPDSTDRRVNPEMVALARESRGMSQAELATRLGVTQGKVSKVEGDMLKLSEADFDRLCRVTEYPPEFFCQTSPIEGFGSACVYHRKRQCLPVKELKVIHATINVVRLQLLRLLKAVDVGARNTFYRFDVDEYGSPEEVARITRASWGLPMGPIRNLVNAIENAGGIVVQLPFGTDKLDAVSQWPRNSSPLFFVNRELPVDRWRFSLAHELGHLVMHAAPPPDAEEQADRFASEFLMPAREIESELGQMTLAKAARLKPVWRVSMQALIRRARDLGRITDRHYRTLFTQIGQEGYRKNEPVPLAPELPTVLPDLIAVYRNSFGYDVSQLSRYVYAAEEHFRATLLNEPPPRFRVVR